MEKKKLAKKAAMADCAESPWRGAEVRVVTEGLNDGASWDSD